MITMDAEKTDPFVKKLQLLGLEVKELHAKYLHSFRLHDTTLGVTAYEIYQDV